METEGGGCWIAGADGGVEDGVGDGQSDSIYGKLRVITYSLGFGFPSCKMRIIVPKSQLAHTQKHPSFLPIYDLPARLKQEE